MKVLCVIDMQRHFGASYKVLHQVLRLCKQCMKSGIPIINVVYGFGGDNDHNQFPSIQRLLKAYPTIVKWDDDGSDMLYDPLMELEPTQVFLCGVNLDACVIDTAIGLRDMGFNVEIIKEASATETTRLRDSNKKLKQSKIPIRNLKETALAIAA